MKKIILLQRLICVRLVRDVVCYCVVVMSFDLAFLVLYALTIFFDFWLYILINGVPLAIQGNDL
jgi:hypothetical protein